MKTLVADAGCWETFLQALEARQFAACFLPTLWDQCGSDTFLPDTAWFWKDNNKVMEIMVLLFKGAFRRQYANKKWSLNSLNWIFQESTSKLLKGKHQSLKGRYEKDSPSYPTVTQIRPDTHWWWAERASEDETGRGTCLSSRKVLQLSLSCWRPLFPNYCSLLSSAYSTRAGWYMAFKGALLRYTTSSKIIGNKL